MGTDDNVPLKIYGLEIAGSDDAIPQISRVRWHSPEYAAGIRPGQSVESVSGCRRDDDRTNSASSLMSIVASPGSASNGRAVPPSIELALRRPLPRSEAVHPTQIYSTIDALILLALLLVYDRFRRRDGVLTALMLTIYRLTRFLGRTHPHRRSRHLGDRAAHFAKHQPWPPGRRHLSLGLCPASDPPDWRSHNKSGVRIFRSRPLPHEPREIR